MEVTANAFFVFFCIVGLALWGLPFYYDFMVEQFGWTRAQVTSSNALSKLVIGPAFGFVAGWRVDRFGPRRMVMAGIRMAGVALVGLGSISTLGMFYSFYMLNALGYVCGGPLPNQVLLSRWFNKSRGRAMGFAYLGIGLGGAAVPWISHTLVEHFGWQAALKILGLLIVVIAFPMAFLVKVHLQPERLRAGTSSIEGHGDFRTVPFCMLTAGSICSIAAVQRHAAEPEAISGSRSPLLAGFGRASAVSVADVQPCWSFADGLACRPLAEKIRDVVDLYARGCSDSALASRAVSSDDLCFRDCVRHRAGRRLDHYSADDRGDFRHAGSGRLLGVILTADGVAEAVSPWMVGRMRDVSGTYSHGFLMLTGMALLGAPAIATLPQRGWPE
jgi:hypothetical protein